MLLKIRRCVISFPSTSDALAAESVLSRLPNHGRLIPVPRGISAGCGYAWKDDIANKDTIQKMLANSNVQTDGYYEYDFMEKQK